MENASKRTVIVAEKPSVARELAKVLGVRGARADGYIADQRYVVTWAIGHLVNIAEPEEQDPAWGGRWSQQQLPMIPGRFKLAVLPSTSKQFSIVRALLTAEDTGEVINATDAGREGELIFRRIALMAGYDKPVKRLWANDMTEEGLKKALARTVPDEQKRDLGLAAFARAEADWLIGMNFSRLFTLKDKSLITVGRVQTPVLKLLVDRRREIEHFTPQDYWTVEASLAREGEAFEAVWHAPEEYKDTRLDAEDEAQAVAGACQGRTGKVLSVESRNGQQKPPLPFDLTTLQREANSRFGLSAKDTLTIAQALYEQKKLLTYPRTDSRYLTRELFKEALTHLRAVYRLFPEAASAAAERIKSGKHKFDCVNDKKVSDHHAIIPTARQADKNALSEDEWNIYEMVCRRFCAAFMAPAKYASSTVWAEIETHRFKATGKIFKDHGWLAAEPWRTAKDNPLPKVRKGSDVTAETVEAKKHQTKPPAHYTDASLLAAMETAGKLVDDEELREAMKERGLGTPATRAQTIETLISRKYVGKDKKRLIATDAGMHAVDLIESLLPDLVSPQMTGDWEKRLKDIEQAQDTYAAFMRDIRAQVQGGVSTVRNWRAYDRDGFPVAPPGAPPAQQAPRPAPQAPPPPPPRPRGLDRDGFPIEAPPAQAEQKPAAPLPAEPLGPCPLCGRDVLEQPESYDCAGRDDGSCVLCIKKKLLGGELPRAQARDLVVKGRTFKRGKFKSKAGKSFNAFLKLDGTRVEPLFE
ncbi:type IA DNA topoisomerase [Desulfocurvus sp. DL9XJH121]